MLHQAKWLGISLTLHLAAATCMMVMAAHNVEHTPKAIMVVLDNLEPLETSHNTPADSITRSLAPARQPKLAKPEMARQSLQSTAPQVQTTIPLPEQNRTMVLPKAAPEVATALTSRPRVEDTVSAPSSRAKMPVPYSAPATEELSMPEKAKQRYLKEHFAYIRDLITRQLAYPPMARKMRWSGKTVVAFVIDEDGAVHNIRVVESSGFPILDNSATETVRNVAPFPKPPVRAEIVVPINFKMM